MAQVTLDKQLSIFKGFCDVSGVRYTTENYRAMLKAGREQYQLADNIVTQDVLAAVYFKIKDQVEMDPMVEKTIIAKANAREHLANLQKWNKDAEDGRHRHLSDEQIAKRNEDAEAQKKADAEAEEKRASDAANALPPIEPTVADALAELKAILDPVTVSAATTETRKAVKAWLRKTNTQFTILIRKVNSELMTKLDRILSKQYEAD